jgi:ferric-dicitrate binding protein FerR (iron transport regulator)
MNRDRNLVAEIILKHARRETLTEEEAAALEAWRAESDDNRRLADLYRDEEWVKEQLKERAAVPSAELWKMVCERTGMDVEGAGVETTPAGRRPLRPPEAYRGRGWRRALRIAAVVLLLLGIGVNLYRRTDGRVDRAVKGPAMAAAPAPTGMSSHYEQVQVLADGQRQVFDSTAWGAAPFPVRLPDGSQVLLCYGSSLRYPAAFDSSHRVVDLNGQACFNITGNKGAPFVVRAGHTVVEVLGTRFNVNGYADDPAKTITLLTGKVRVLQGGQQRVLRPSEQAVVMNGRITVHRPDHPGGVVGWGDKEPYFEFDRTDLNTVIREIAKWYRLTVFNPEHVTGVTVSGKFMLKDPKDSNLAIIRDVERPNVKVERRGDSLFLLRGRQSFLSK